METPRWGPPRWTPPRRMHRDGNPTAENMRRNLAMEIPRWKPRDGTPAMDPPPRENLHDGRFFICVKMVIASRSALDLTLRLRISWPFLHGIIVVAAAAAWRCEVTGYLCDEQSAVGMHINFAMATVVSGRVGRPLGVSQVWPQIISRHAIGARLGSGLACRCRVALASWWCPLSS